MRGWVPSSPGCSSSITARGIGTTHLRPIDGERVHVHRIEPAGEALVEGAEGVAEVAQALDVRVEGLDVVEELAEGGLEEAEAVGRIGVGGGAGEAAKGALGDASERRGHRVHRVAERGARAGQSRRVLARCT